MVGTYRIVLGFQHKYTIFEFGHSHFCFQSLLTFLPWYKYTKNSSDQYLKFQLTTIEVWFTEESLINIFYNLKKDNLTAFS